MFKKVLLVIVTLCLYFGAAAHAAQTLLVLGDSLSAGYGLAREESWVSLLQQRLQREQPNWQVFNASISGETTSGGLFRLDKLLAQQRPALVIIELGANDGLRGLDLATTRKNLEAMIQRARKSGASVLLVGMRLPPNYGKSYTDQFHRLFAELARKHKIAHVPFFLTAIVGRREYFQLDGLHPSAAAQPLLLDTVWAQLHPMLKR